MDHKFWMNCWTTNAIGFHESSPNGLLRDHFSSFSNKVAPKRVLVPMCGKSLDMPWLMAQGCHVVGVELSDIAIHDFFKSLNITPAVKALDTLTLYSAPKIDIFVGDLFHLTSPLVGTIDAIYDRAALVAWDPKHRNAYVNHLIDISGMAPQLVNIFQHPTQDNPQHPVFNEGPPFLIPPSEMRTLYESYNLVSPIEHAHSEKSIRNTLVHECLWQCIPHEI